MKLLQLVRDDYTTYSGRVLEDYFVSCIANTPYTTHVPNVLLLSLWDILWAE